MTEAKKKADELVEKFRKATDGIAPYNYDSVNKQCALITVEEIMKFIENDCPTEVINERFDFWFEVKSELEKM